MSQSDIAFDPEDMTAILEDSSRRVIQRMEQEVPVELDDKLKENLQNQMVQRNFGLAYHLAKNEGLAKQFVEAIQKVAEKAGIKLEAELIEQFCKDN